MIFYYFELFSQKMAFYAIEMIKEDLDQGSEKLPFLPILVPKFQNLPLTAQSPLTPSGLWCELFF